MKKRIGTIIVFALAVFLLSCEALPFNYSSAQSWFIPEKISGGGTKLAILFVKVERSGGWDNVEKETASLAPLYFWDQGCKVVSAEEGPSYAVGIQLREREYNLGWRTKRSLAIEVRIWACEDSADDYEKKLPIAVGRIVAVGEKSFSSSDTTGRLLSKAIKEAVNELSAHERKKDA